MASFLNGLMGALKGAGSGTASAGRGLMGAIDPALAGTAGGAARAPGTGGLMPSIADLTTTRSGRSLAHADPSLDDPISRTLGVDVMQRMPTMEAKPKAGFFDRMREVDPETGMSFVDKAERIGGAMRDDGAGAAGMAAVDKRAAGRLSQQAQADLAAQIDSLFPDDPRMQFLLKANPEKATEALASIYQKEREPYTLSEGQRRGMGGELIDYAPETGFEGGYAYRTEADGDVQIGAQRPRNWDEIERERHNREQERLGQGGLGVSQGNLDLSRRRFNFDRSKPAGGGGGAPSGLPPLPPGFRPVR